MADNSLELARRIKSAVEGPGEVAKLAQEIEGLGGDATAVRQQAQGLADEMARLGRQQGLIDRFKALSGAAKTADQVLAQSQQHTRDPALQYQQSAANVEAVSNALANAKRALSGTFDPTEAKALEAERIAIPMDAAVHWGQRMCPWRNHVNDGERPVRVPERPFRVSAGESEAARGP